MDDSGGSPVFLSRNMIRYQNLSGLKSMKLTKKMWTLLKYNNNIIIKIIILIITIKIILINNNDQ